MIYEPLPGYRVGLDFRQAYTVPPGYRVGLEFVRDADPPGDTQYVFPLAWLSSGFGDARVRLAVQHVLPFAVEAPTFTGPALDLRTRYVGAVGWGSSNVGVASAIENRNKELLHGGWDALSMGAAHDVYLYTRYLMPVGAAVAEYGTARTEHGVRRLNQVGADALALGMPWVSRSPRELAPAGIAAPEVMESHVVGGLRFIEPVGTEMTQWGTRIIPEQQVVLPQGFSGEVGQPAIRNWHTFTRPEGFQTAVQEQLRWGVARVWNLRQIVQQHYDPNDGLNPPPFGQWTAIENRNRAPVAVGWISDRFGYTQIDNKAVAVLPAGIAPPEHPEHYKAGSVTHLNRPVSPDGFDASAIPGWAAVYNKADPVRATGWPSQSLGQPQIANRSRLYERIGGMDLAAVGTPMLAPRVRRLQVEERHTIEPPTIPLPYVGLYTRYVGGVSVGDVSGAGAPELGIHWRIITPRWTHRDMVGEPALRNVTPELRTYGAASDEFGNASVRLQWRQVLGLGESTDQFGQARVADRRNWAFIAGLPPQQIPRPVVTKRGGLPEAQNIIVQGIDAPPGQVPAPTLNLLFAYPTGWDGMRVASPTVVANSIRVEPGYWDHLIGEPTLTFKNRTLTGAGGIDAVAVVGRPRLSPHTIYAVMEAPDQAQANHPGPRLHYVDHSPDSNSPLKGPGVPRVSMWIGQVWAWGIDAPWMPAPSLINRRKYVAPVGFNSLRGGVPDVPGPRGIEQFAAQDAQAFGEASVARPPYTGPQYLGPAGVEPPVGDGTRVEMFHRQLVLAGWQSLALGASWPDDTPYMWQTLHVGPPMPVLPAGFEADLHGTPWVSHRVREVRAEGLDAFACEYDYTAFHLRMRVWGPAPARPRQALVAAGFAAGAVGTPGVRSGVHYIRPDGNSDQHRKGAF